MAEQAGISPLSWGLCIATLNRHDMLERSVGLALRQSLPPTEVVIVDSSDNWEEGRRRITLLVSATPSVSLTYLFSSRRSSASQRNMAVEAARADVVFLFDDDTLMYPDCAERMMEIYGGRPWVAAVGAANVGTPPGSVDRGERESGNEREEKSRRADPLGHLKFWAIRHVLMLHQLAYFVPYFDVDDRRLSLDKARLGDCPAVSKLTLMGYCMTVRRTVALAEPFDAYLLAYSPAEDCDASFRFWRHGSVLHSLHALVHHAEAPLARLKRKKVAALMTTNCAYFTKLHSTRPEAHRRRIYWLTCRRLFAEALKDLLRRRWTFPQATGTAEGLRRIPSIFAHPSSGLGEWYEKMQREILES
jgi:glycosyltransferase involved in cell wall biosynthesis